MHIPETLSAVWTHLSDIQPLRGEGIYLYDQHEIPYMDFTSGIGVTNTGHCHPMVVQAVQQQAETLLFGQINCVIPPATVRLSQKLAAVCPPGIEQFFFANSGAEATEAAAKLAKSVSGRSNIIVFQGSFHGRTHMAMAMTTSKTVYRQGYQPFPAGIFVAPFPYAYQFGWDEATTLAFCEKQLDLLLHGQTAPEETAAIIIEPVLGEGGYVPAPPAFLHHLRTICDQHGILLIIDEVQSGFGRTGKLFCLEHAGVRPDIMIMAKGLGSGLPISAIGASKRLMAGWKAGTHGGTYGGGSAVSSAAACATLDAIEEGQLIHCAAKRGAQLQAGLIRLQQKFPIIGDVRGLGLMIATEFTDPGGKPDSKRTGAVIAACLRRRLLLLSCGTYTNVVRWIPPLVVTEQEIEQALSIFEEALMETAP